VSLLDPELEEIAQHYVKSTFVKELCVLRLASADASADEWLHGVVVPDMALIRERRIVNIGDLLRFEMEGQSISLPEHKRLRGFEIWFEMLPRTAAGALERGEIERRVREQRGKDRSRADAERREWMKSADAADVVRILARRAGGREIFPEANLEIDLGLDSMERVELIAELDYRLGLRFPPEHAHDVLTVSQLLDALQPAGARATHEATDDDMWSVLLRDLPDASEPMVRPLLERHLLKSVFFLFLRTVRLVMAPMRITGLEHLPAHGVFILTPNHQSFLDPFFICAALPHRVVRDLFAVGATEYFETPLMVWAARQLNLVRVDPDSNLVPAMRAAASGLRHGRILILFPEGERSIDGRVKRFKKGAAILSRQLGVPIVPVALRGLFELWPRNRALNWRVLLPWSRHRIEIAFGPAMRLEEGATYASSAARLQQHVTEMWESSQQGRNQQRAGHAPGEKDG
jgi:long-chain acyl-CoA synthetase